MHRILLDNNVIIDIIQETRPLHKVASLIMDDITTGKYEGVIASKSVSDVSYIYIQDAEHRHPDETRRERAKRIRSLIHDLVVVLDVAPITKENILEAIDSSVDDLEDAIIASAAETTSADLIITSNIKDFVNSPIPAITPTEFLDLCSRDSVKEDTIMECISGPLKTSEFTTEMSSYFEQPHYKEEDNET